MGTLFGNVANAIWLGPIDAEQHRLVVRRLAGNAQEQCLSDLSPTSAAL